MHHATRAITRLAVAAAAAATLTACAGPPRVEVGFNGPGAAAAVLPPPAQTIAERAGGPLPHERFEFDRNSPPIVRNPDLPYTAHWPADLRPLERPVRFRLWEQR